MNKINTILQNALNKKRWQNNGDFCNKKNHPFQGVSYRRYRRGSKRCSSCGARIGKVVCERKSFSENIIDNIYQETPLFKILSK